MNIETNQLYYAALAPAAAKIASEGIQASAGEDVIYLYDSVMTAALIVSRTLEGMLTDSIHVFTIDVSELNFDDFEVVWDWIPDRTGGCISYPRSIPVDLIESVLVVDSSLFTESGNVEDFSVEYDFDIEDPEWLNWVSIDKNNVSEKLEVNSEIHILKQKLNVALDEESVQVVHERLAELYARFYELLMEK